VNRSAAWRYARGRQPGRSLPVRAAVVSSLPSHAYNDADPAAGLLLWLLAAGAPAGGGGLCAGGCALLLLGLIGISCGCAFLHDVLAHWLHAMP
jgi:hypothetical protein